MSTSFDQLARLIITRVPSGFQQTRDDIPDMGPADLAKASGKDHTPNARKVLSEEGFVRGYARMWVGPKQAQIIVIIDQFRSSAGARPDYERRASDSRAHHPPGSHLFVPAGLPPDQALGGTSHDARFGTVALILFTTRVYVAQVLCNGPGSETMLTRRVHQLAVTQFARLTR